MPSKKFKNVKPYINTFKGRAYYSHTEVETKHGNWNDRWLMSAGEFVIHEGKKHHVYKIRNYKRDWAIYNTDAGKDYWK